MQQPVAIKHLKPEIIAGAPQIVERFAREAEALRQLDHPNIVKMIGLFEQDSQHYLITEYVGGGDLGQVLHAEGAFNIRRVLEIGLDLADALTRTHRLRIIHRDLKPGNVLITEQGTPKLSDFGVALIGTMERVTGSGGLMIGTLDYMAPETFDGSQVDARADIWAFGVLLFEMLTCQRPFKGDNVAQMMMNIINQPVPDLEALRPDAPIALVDLIYRMLVKDRDRRIGTVRQVGLEIESLLQGKLTDTVSAQVVIKRGEPRFEPTPVSEETRHNLPAQTMPFIGREVELSALAKLLADPAVRLITIVAPGGMGKTRLSVETARGQLSRFSDGVYAVELAPLSEPEHIATALAEALNFQLQEDGRSPRQQMIEHLHDKNVLLVLDNFEHLIEGAGIVADLLRGGSQLKILATSRQRLNQTGETVVALDGITFPDWETPEDALEYAAVKLFMFSARQVRPDFELRAEDLNAVARICRIVQGMPLGLVLAASWLEMLSPAEIAEEIGKSLDFLASELTDLPERQHSIRAVFDYSWNLLNEAERETFKKLSVFRGGFTREAAQAVVGSNLRVLMTLVNKSLLRRDPESGRYSIHELLRQYAEEQLHDQVESVLRAHSTYYTHWLSQREPDIKGRDQLAALRDIDADFENVRCAWGWAAQNQAESLIDAAAETLTLYMLYRNRRQEGQAMMSSACEHLPRGRVWGRALLRLNRLRDVFSNVEEMRRALEQVEDDPLENGIALMEIANYHMNRGEFTESIEHLVKARPPLETVNDPFYLALLDSDLGFCYGTIGDLDNAVVYARRAADSQRAHGNKFGLVISLNLLGGILFITDPRKGIIYAEETFATAKAVHYHFFAVWTASNLAVRHALVGHIDQANMVVAEAEKLLQYLDSRSKQVLLWSRVVIAVASGDFEGARTYGLAGMESELFNSDHKANIRLYLALAYLGTGEIDAAWEHALECLKFNQETHRKRYLNLNVVAVAGILAYRERSEAAVAYMAAGWLGTVTNLLVRHPFYAELRAALRAELGEAVFEAAWERGRALDLDTAATDLLVAVGS